MEKHPIRQHELSYEEVFTLVQEIAVQQLPFRLNNKQNLVTILNKEASVLFELQLPQLFPEIPNDKDFSAYLEDLSPFPPPGVVFLIQAGSCALGYFEYGEALHHKVIRKYMTRKKQGKSQVKHLKTRGKSRLGSRIRLANTTAFFEEINTYLNEWAKFETIDYFFYSCSQTLWPLLFDSKTKPPFNKRDKILHKLPFDTHTPNFEELLRVYQLLKTGHVRFFQPPDEAFWADILPIPS